MDEYQRFIFDTQGCLILPDLLTRDQVDRLIAGFPRDAKGQVIREPDNGLLAYDEPLFRDLVNHPQVLPYLTTLLADYHRPEDEPWQLFLDHEYFMYLQPGEECTPFHNGGTPYTPWYRYTVQGGKIYCGLLTVLWSLCDAGKDEGGFWYIPGSHQANFPMPSGMTDYTWVPDCTVQPAVTAGSAIIFTEALVHGTRPWRAQHDRYALFYKYLPGYMGLGRNNLEQRTSRLDEAQVKYVVPSPPY
ncbi:MAG: hypothetical protein GKR89_08195 [Candidatus Latescibacteria bacterium]|nr:hypothetical protein [Candidatus Latescibacterota bacterium]